MDQPSRFHLHLGGASRTKGDSAARCIAYATGSHIRDVWTGRSHNFSRRSDVIDIQVENFAGSPEELAWLLDSFERRRNSVTAYKMDYAIPHVLSAESRKLLNRRISQQLAYFLNVPMVSAEHAATQTEDVRNTHTHTVFGTRQFEGGVLGPKLRILSVRKSGREVVSSLRWLVFYEIRTALIEAGREQEVEHWHPGSHWARGIDRVARAHIPHRYFCAQRGAQNRIQNSVTYDEIVRRVEAIRLMVAGSDPVEGPPAVDVPGSDDPSIG